MLSVLLYFRLFRNMQVCVAVSAGTVGLRSADAAAGADVAGRSAEALHSRQEQVSNVHVLLVMATSRLAVLVDASCRWVLICFVLTSLYCMLRVFVCLYVCVRVCGCVCGCDCF